MKKCYVLIGLILAGSAVLWFVSKSRTFQFFGEIYPRVSTNQKVIALTFDDGPTNNTDTILTILRELDIKATFFVTGKDLVTYEGQGQKIVAAGHQLGNHTYSHHRMLLKSLAFVREEVEKTDLLIHKAGYDDEILFRPPYGKKLLALPYYLKQTNRKTIMWDVEPESYAHIADDSEKIKQYVLDNTQPGSIILLHVMYDQKESVKAIKNIVTGLKGRGFSFKTVTELLQYRPDLLPLGARNLAPTHCERDFLRLSAYDLQPPNGRRASIHQTDSGQPIH